MDHEHDWKPMNITTTFTLQFKLVETCTECGKIRTMDRDSDVWEEL